MHGLKGRIFGFLLVLSSLAFVQPPEASLVTYSQIVINYNFAESVVFEARIQPAEIIAEIDHIELYIYPSQEAPVIETVQFDPSGKINHSIEISPLKWDPFITVLFRFEAFMKNGMQSTSELYSFQYDDNRLEWKSISSPPFTVYWHTENSELGQMILQTAFAGLQSARGYTGTDPENDIRIYAYSNPEYLRTALGLEDLSLVAGHTDPSNRVILVSAPPGPGLQLEMERQIPHEIAHILTFELSEKRLDALPLWLVEGIATISELYPNSDYQRILNTAASSGGLIPMESLCESFPENPSAAYLAYAQSGSFVNFLYKRFGTTGLDQLILAYSNGTSCTNSIESVLGETFNELEYSWQMEVLGIDSDLFVFQNLSPYLVFLATLIVIPVAPFVFNRKQKRNSRS
jgi:hypothetical protein